MCDFELTESDVSYIIGFEHEGNTLAVPPNEAPIPWSCPHPADDGEYCVFHRGWIGDIPAAEEIESAFIDVLADSERPNEFLGLRCNQLEFDSINLKVSGVPRQIRLEHALVSDKLSFENTVLPTGLELSFSQCAHFEFVESTINGDLVANHSDLGEVTELDKSTVEGTLECDEAWLGVHVFGARELVVRDDASFIHTNFGYREGRITSTFSLSDATISNNLVFNGTQFSDEVHLKGTTASYLNISDATIYDIFDASEFEASKARLGYVYSRGDTDKIDFSHAEINGGEIRLNDSSDHLAPVDVSKVYDDVRPVWIDFTNSLLGSVEIYDQNSEHSLRNVRLFETMFEGFTWMKYRSYLSRNEYNIHGLGAEFDADPVTKPSRLETTYLRAKNSANEMGEIDVAAEFFRKKMHYRRKGHAIKARIASPWSRVRAAGAYISNLLLDLTTGYGERPSYVAMNVFVWIAAGTIVLRQLNALSPQADLVDYLIFSAQSFVALIVGTPIDNQSLPVRITITSLALLGAFYIALAVFTLTRSVDR